MGLIFFFPFTKYDAMRRNFSQGLFLIYSKQSFWQKKCFKEIFKYDIYVLKMIQNEDTLPITCKCGYFQWQIIKFLTFILRTPEITNSGKSWKHFQVKCLGILLKSSISFSHICDKKDHGFLHRTYCIFSGRWNVIRVFWERQYEQTRRKRDMGWWHYRDTVPSNW